MAHSCAQSVQQVQKVSSSPMTSDAKGQGCGATPSLPQWPQKANQLRKVRGLRARLRNELAKLASLADQMGITTEGISAMQLLDEIEWYIEDQPGDSPTYTEMRK